ncbi:hypothetical protein ACFQX7_34085 [Luedemannella flava]
MRAPGVLPDLHETPNALTERFCETMAADLASASLYVMSPEMTDVTAAAAITLRPDDLSRLRRSDVPTGAGLLVLPHALRLRNGAGDFADVRGLAWAPTTVARPGEDGLPGVRVTCLLDTYGREPTAAFHFFEQQARVAGDPLPALLPDSVKSITFGDRETSPDDDETDDLLATYRPGAPIHDPDGTFARRYLHAYWRLLRQRIAANERIPVSHVPGPIRSGGPKQADVSLVRLIERRDAGFVGARAVEIKKRWPARMHKNLTWCPIDRTHKPAWEGPFPA